MESKSWQVRLGLIRLGVRLGLISLGVMLAQFVSGLRMDFKS
jgi:hypothetical protein